MEKPIEIIVGGSGLYDPAAGQPDCLIPTLRGSDLLVRQRGVGEKSSSEIQILSAGGFRLVGDNFYLGDKYFVYRVGVFYESGSSSYTNGFNFNRVIGSLFGRIGWRAGTIAGAPGVDVNNASSKSGRYFDDFHPLCTINTVKAIIEDDKASDEEINAFIQGLQRGAIMRALNGVLNEPEFIELSLDFDRYREQNDRTVEPAGLFVGRRITPARLPEVSVQLDSVSLLFSEDVTFPLYLFQEGKSAPLWTGNVTAIANETTLVNLPDLILGYLGSNHMGGAYYFGYFQEDLGTARAIDQSRISFNCANNWGIEFIETAKIPGFTNFERKVINGSPWSHGLNLQISAFKDWTTWIVKKSTIFDELIGLNMSVMIIERALLNVRSNPTERILKDQLAAAGLWQQLEGAALLNPDSPKIIGLRDQISRECHRVKKSFYPIHKAINYSLD